MKEPIKGINECFTKIKETFEITKETIIKYKMKDEFPEAFEVKLEVGKWYKTKSNCLFNLNEITDNFYLGYGFTKSMTYYSHFKEYIRTELKEATEQEVFEALKNEAVKRGFKEGVYIDKLLNYNQGTHKTGFFKTQVSYESFSFDIRYNYLFIGNLMIFRDGIWATIIPTKTKEESEKLLNCKILN